MERKKVPFINVAKGIGIFLVVLGHVVIPEMRENSIIAQALFDVIYSFHMPLFVALSGYLFELNLEKYENNGFRHFITGKFRVLIIPYLCFSIISYVGINMAFHFPPLADMLTRGGYKSVSLTQSVFQILTHVDHLDKHLWFIYALFIIFLISYPLRKIAKTPYFLLGVYIVYFFLPQERVPGIVTRVILYTIYFNLSRHLALINKWACRKRILPAFAIFLVLYAISQIDITVVKKLTEIPVAAAGSLVIVAISATLGETMASKLTTLLGNYSYDIYLIHQPFLVSGIGGVLLLITSWPYVVVCAITLVTGIAVPILLSKYVLRRVKILRILFLGGH